MRPLLTALALLTLVFGNSPAAVIDSYDQPFPPNPSLVSGKPLLFIGTICDGTTCPPDPTAFNSSSDEAQQTGLPGIPQGYRRCTFSAEGFDAVQDQAILEVRGGALHIANRGIHAIRVALQYGGFGHELGFDLARDGTDRFELDIVNEGATFAPFQLDAFYYTITSAGPWPVMFQSFQVTAPGTIRIPYDRFTGTPGSSYLYEVDWVEYRLIHFQPGQEIRIEEFRTAATPTPATAATWGRIKAGYR